MEINLQQIISRVLAGQATETDLQKLIAAIQSRQLVLATGEGAISINGDASDSVNVTGDNNHVVIVKGSESKVIEQILLSYVRIDGCRDCKELEQYFKTTLTKLKQKGCLDIRQNVTHKSIQFNYIAKIKDFEAGLGMRGEAFFLFSEFTDLKMPTLQQFSAQSMLWARKSVSPDAAGQAFFNFRMPTHLCFAIAIVDELDPEIRISIQTTNPFDLRVDMLWYEIPVVYELSQQKIYFYDQPTNFFEQFKGEIVWKQLRTIIQQILGGCP